MFGTLKIEYDLSKNEELNKKVRGILSEMMTSMLYSSEKNGEFIKLIESAILKYFEWKHTSLEDFVRQVVIDEIGRAMSDRSTSSSDEKSESVIVQLVREAILNTLEEKLKNITITGME